MSEKTWTKTQVEAIVLKALETYQELREDSWFDGEIEYGTRHEEAMEGVCRVVADILDGKVELS